MKKVSKRLQLTRVCKPPFKEYNTYIYIYTYICAKSCQACTQNIPFNHFQLSKLRSEKPYCDSRSFQHKLSVEQNVCHFPARDQPREKEKTSFGNFYLHSGQNLARCQNMPTVQVKSTIVSQHYRHISSKSKNGRRPKPSHNAVVAALLNLPCVLPA